MECLCSTCTHRALPTTVWLYANMEGRHTAPGAWRVGCAVGQGQVMQHRQGHQVQRGRCQAAYLKTAAGWASPSSYSQSSVCASSFLNASRCFSVVT